MLLVDCLFVFLVASDGPRVVDVSEQIHLLPAKAVACIKV